MGLLYLSFAYNCHTIAEPLLLYLRRNTIEEEKKKKKRLGEKDLDGSGKLVWIDARLDRNDATEGI